MFNLVSVRKLIAASCTVTLLAACAAESPTSPSMQPSSPFASKGGGTTPAPLPAGPFSGIWSGTLDYHSPIMVPYQVSIDIVQSGTGFSGTFTQILTAGDRPITMDASGAIGNGKVSLTLRPQKGKPGAQSTSYFGTISADSSTMTLTATTGAAVITVSR